MRTDHAEGDYVTASGIPFEFKLVPEHELHPHEEVLPDRVPLIAKLLARDGYIMVPVVVDRASGTILDGHHRYSALRSLGCRFIPCARIDYQDPRISVEAWRDGETPPTKDEIVKTALAGKVYPPKTTRHPLLNAFDEVPTKLERLR